MAKVIIWVDVVWNKENIWNNHITNGGGVKGDS